jgi:eukaryotic-like serine/threonine-protein kinase
MALEQGTQLGSYEVIELLGAGGMGEVYRARDTRLRREVAIKVLPEMLAADPDRIARFQREAELLATLNHPNIAAVYGLEDSPSTGSAQAPSRAIVLELVDGETLADLIARGPVPLDDALRMARQIVDALEAAHDRGVVHRDLKPANIKITPDGKLKVLDFGLAKMLESPAMASSLSMSPTLSVHATYAGVILGTAAYMSPEQARGKMVDRRADVWAFGCVVFEMLTGKRTFDPAGDTVSDAVAAVLTQDPDWSALPAGTPPHIVALLRRCLQKDLQRRLPHIGVARLEIDEGPAASSGATASVSPTARAAWRAAAPVAAFVLLTAALFGGAWIYMKAAAGASPIVTKFTVTLPEGQNFSNIGRQAVAISPDGAQILYSANQRLYLRGMSELQPRAIPGFDGSNAVISPVFSPDGSSIAFYSGGAEQSLKRVAVTGGAPVTIGSFTNPVGMSWGPDGILLAQNGKGVVRISPNGGTPEVIVSTKADEIAHGPQMLPGGRAVLFTLAKGNAPTRWDKAQIVAQVLASGERKVLIDGGSDARYLSTGHLVYALAGVVLAVPFDLERLQVTGGPVPMIEGVRRAAGSVTGVTQFSVSNNGSLVYVPGPASLTVGERELALVDRRGAPSSIKLPPGAIDHPRVSPDGKRVVFVTDDDKGTVVWTYELSGATAMHRVTFNGRNRFPIWTSDGQRVVFQSDREGDLGIFWQRADGVGGTERLTTADKDTEHIPESWSPKNDGFLFRTVKAGQNTLSTLSYFSVIEKKARPFGGVQSVTPTNASFSPDGKWVVYEMSALSGNSAQDNGPARAVYVQPFPESGATYQVPIIEQGGYRNPRWSPDGKEIFYIIGGNVRLRVASVTTQPNLVFGNSGPLPKPNFWQDAAADRTRQWDVMPDGQRFLVVVNAGQIGQGDSNVLNQQLQVVLNWFEELKQRAPSK